MMDWLTPYYGTDWLGMVLMLGYVYLLGSRRREGFLVGVASNITWGIFGVLALSWPTVGTNLILLVLNVRGYIHWRKPDLATSKDQVS
ncbi:MAG: hypothetical protein KF745_05810 [Phycisphaeraceae bacterium]|nr:hypothetical protein [Phycisphaeraceae bacterium]